MKRILLASCLLLFIHFLTGQESNFKNLQWRSIGPANMGGRVTDIVGIPGDPSTFYFAGADGGVVKASDK